MKIIYENKKKKTVPLCTLELNTPFELAEKVFIRVVCEPNTFTVKHPVTTLAVYDIDDGVIVSMGSQIKVTPLDAELRIFNKE